MDLDAARSSGIHEAGVDAVDFVADFPGGFGGGYSEASFAKDGMVSGSDSSGFAGSPGGVGAGDDFALQAVAADDFVAEVPGCDATGEHYFIKDMKLVVNFDSANGGKGVNVEVETKDQRKLWDVFYGFLDILVREIDGDEAG